MRGGAAAILVAAAMIAASVVEASEPGARPGLEIAALPSPVTVRLRGLSAVSEQVAWASGKDGTVLRTVDGGKSWRASQVPGASDLDFRDVHAFGAEDALVMGAGAGEASRVYRTSDGGRTWVLVLRNPDAEGFFDCMDFDGDEGRLLGDPVRGRFQVFESRDRGRSWWRIKGPRARKNEAAFAASGTCLRRVPGGTVIVSGGSVARMHFLPDRFQGRHDWHAIEAPMPSHAASSGLFSLASAAGWTVAVGGDYRQERGAGLAFSAEVSSEVTWTGSIRHEGVPVHLARGPGINDFELRRVLMLDAWSGAALHGMRIFHGAPSGYRSAVACSPGAEIRCIATGPSGTDVLEQTREAASLRPAGVAFDVPVLGSVDRWAEWRAASTQGYDSVAIAGRVAWFSGSDGRLGRAELPASE